MTPTRFLVAQAANADWQAALNDCVARLKSALAERRAGGEVADYTLGWCYLTDQLAGEAENIVHGLNRRLPSLTWVGTVGLGVIAGDTARFDEPALALMIAPLPAHAFHLFSGRQPLHPGVGGFHPHTALVHADGGTPDLQELLQELAARTASGHLFGGLSAARNRTLQIAGGVLSGGLSGVAFDERVGIVSRVTQGCQPVGPLRTITHAEDNYVIALDGQPALACALQDLGLEHDLPLDLTAHALAGTLVGLCTDTEDLALAPGLFGPDTRVRHIIGLDPQHQVLAVADEVAPGMQLAFCRRDAQAALADLTRIAAEIRAELASTGRQAAGAVYVSCTGRGGRHFGSPHAEARAIREELGADLALVGFHAAGEIARDRLYGYTGVLTVFTAPA
ncbi:FIST signal transduction protein [Pseudothauera rhizosphaerae]|uniref:Small ligand-binding sensory domain FIST n=1 Tax=Pseudothauera rhizosphaerae TaxID=2565932 RepID=A0A4S4AQX3_9RHOO|nr:FIST N-terminal domain-containing protein [Pseudothauera rhizosphaerae]THF62170.1 hypothetical protein E6O51_08440 [Pseudothauera rhizosphaerae]